ncbi:guanylate kinase [Pediococcus stilesii]|uniref:Guanylate kinase n=1 Tax=Pediococcus stilesii TaxID=331679 RepID=A0A5R9BYF3_9LACO|nr:AAA family ATPase [Pediococcus stilesii]TLQ05667.1 guanylate kinase [Pediococcus stilesii]
MNKIIVIAGPTGSGKTSVADYLKDQYGVAKVITHTTRPRRENERQGVDYYFESDATFDDNHYLEQVQYSHYRYGSSLEGLRRAWDKSKVASIVLDTAGAITYLHELKQQTKILFISVSDERVLKTRLLKRGDDPAAIAKRMNSPEYRRDMQLPIELVGNATKIINDQWQDTKKQIDQFYQQVTNEI